MEIPQIATLSVFAILLVLSAARVAHPAALALAAALGLSVWNGHAVLAGIRADVLLTAAGVLVLAGFLKRSGLVSWLVLKAAKSARGRARGILLRTGVLAFAVGALFGPAAAALVLPVALLLAVELDVPPLPFIVTLSWCSVLGGTVLLTAQPGNLWVGSVLGIDGGTWLLKMLPFSAAALAATLALALAAFRPSLRVTNERRARVLEYDENKALEDKPLTAKTVAVIALVAGGLILQPWLGIEPAVVVLGGALLLSLLAGRNSVALALSELGADLLWYGALLAVMGAVSSTGFWSLASWHPEPLALLWGAAAAGSFVDPGTVAGSLATALQGWPAPVWSLVVLGAALGGGATLWTARSTALNAAVGGRGPGWTRVILWSLAFSIVNLVVVSVLWTALR